MPSAKRPFEAVCRSQQAFATTIGLRGKAMATAVPSSIRFVAVAATACARNGSWRFSIVSTPSKPAASASAAAADTSFRSFCGRVVRMRMAAVGPSGSDCQEPAVMPWSMTSSEPVM